MKLSELQDMARLLIPSNSVDQAVIAEILNAEEDEPPASAKETTKSLCGKRAKFGAREACDRPHGHEGDCSWSWRAWRVKYEALEQHAKTEVFELSGKLRIAERRLKESEDRVAQLERGRRARKLREAGRD